MKLQHGFLKGTFNDVWSFSFVPGYKQKNISISRRRRSKKSRRSSQSRRINLENVSKMNYLRSKTRSKK